MINEAELNTIKGVMHYLNDSANEDCVLSFDVQIIDPNGDVLCRLERLGDEYQMLFGESS